MNEGRKILQIGPGTLLCLAIALTGPSVHLSQAAQGFSDMESLGRPPSPIALYQPSVAVGQNQDGRLEAFVVGIDGSLFDNWQLTPNGVWGGWARLGNPPGISVSSPVVARDMFGRLTVFTIGSDGAVWLIRQFAANSGWDPWERLGSPSHVSLTSVAVGQNADGRLEVFSIGTDKGLWHIWEIYPYQGWGYWTPFGSPGGIRYSPVVGQNQDGRLAVFVVRADGKPYRIEQRSPNGDWYPWLSLSLWTIISSPAVIQDVGGRLMFAYVWSNVIDAQRQTAANSLSWQGVRYWCPHFMGGISGLFSSPALGLDRSRHVLLFAVCSCGELHVKDTTSSASPVDGAGWESISSYELNPSVPPVVAKNQDGRLEVFAIDIYGNLRHAWQR